MRTSLELLGPQVVEAEAAAAAAMFPAFAASAWFAIPTTPASPLSFAKPRTPRALSGWMASINREKGVTGKNRVVMFAGQRYREFLVEPLRRQGIEVEIPMANLAIGKQLAWLSQNQ
jgi:hypothetical protein